MADFYCKHCGFQSPNASNVTASYCPKHPFGPNKGKHALYEGSEKAEYTCVNCRSTAPSIAGLTANRCSKHPKGENKGRHEPEL